MKKLLFPIILSIFSLKSHCQILNCNATYNYRDSAYEILKNLDKSLIPTGVLYENVYPMSEIEFYTGLTNTDTSNHDHFIQAWDELYGSTFNTTGLKHFSTLEDLVQDFHPDGKYNHPVGIIDYQYSTINPDAVTNNLIFVQNDKLYDTPGRTLSPYDQNATIVASILLTDEYPCLYPGLHTIFFKDDFILTNTGYSLSSITHIKITQNNNTIYDNPASGIADLTIPIIIPNNGISQVITFEFTIGSVVKKCIIESCTISTEPLTSCKGGQKIDLVGYAYDGGYGKGQHSEHGVVNIYFANENCISRQLKKVVLFVDGFDAGNTQHHEGIWKDYLNKEFNDVNNLPKKLGDELLEQGYDVVILDQKKTGKYNTGGAGLIENNGLVLAKLLDTLYTLYGQSLTQDFVVVGASMGGLVSRFGLTWMEHNNKPHHTRLFISFDSPQEGANIPLGLQHLVNSFTQNGILSISNKISNGSHYSNAAKQLLIHHSDTQSETTESHEFRQRWINNVASVGDYPKLCRNVSIINGNRDGILKKISPNPSEIPNLYEKDKFLDLGLKRKLAIGCNSNICYKLHAQSYAQSENGRFKTFEISVNNVTRLYNFLTGTSPLITSIKYTQPENGMSYDIAPGSRLRINPFKDYENQKTLRLINFSLSLIGGLSSGTLKFNVNNTEFLNFIPTISSVAYKPAINESRNIYKNFVGINLSKCASTTPFDTVYAFGRDMLHVDIDQNIANAFRNEVYNIIPISTCSGGCPEYVNLTDIPANSNYQAAKVICLLPNFKVESGTVFKAEIGCISTTISKYTLIPIPQTSSVCTFEFNLSRNETVCTIGPNVSNFKMFVSYLPLGDYAEFSLDGTSWVRANIGDIGAEWLLLSGITTQSFYSRPHSNPSNVIQQTMSYCP